MTQSESEKLFKKWLHEGKFTLNGLTYKMGVNDSSAIKAMVPSDKKMTGKICYLSSELTLTNADLDENFHEGFTIGSGKTMYWSLIWHASGNCTIYNKNYSARWISGDTVITVHFK